MELERERKKAQEAQAGVVIANKPVVVSACPGAGKTRVLIERAQRKLLACGPCQGVAILSFSNAAIHEIENRLSAGPIEFPSFLGTFDSFMLKFLVAPFGADGGAIGARLIPDLETLTFSPVPASAKGKKMRLAKLGWFDCETGALRKNLSGEDQREADGFDGLGRYEPTARSIWRRLKDEGSLGHDQARVLALRRLGDKAFDQVVGALGERFAEIIVDEAQDCNPEDIDVVLALRKKGVAISVIADTDQAIYGFRHGGAPALKHLTDQYPLANQHSLVHNFRSNQRICGLASVFRAGQARNADCALMRLSKETDGAYLIPYKPGRGGAVPGAIAQAFGALLDASEILHASSPIIAHRENNARRAAGLMPINGQSKAFSIRLASAVASYAAAGGHWRTRADALKRITALVFELRGVLGEEETLQQYLDRRNETLVEYRAEMFSFTETIRPLVDDSAESWLARVKTAVKVDYPDASTAKLRMPVAKSKAEFEKALSVEAASAFPISTIHCVKGQEFPGVCVVIPPSNIVEVLDHIGAGVCYEAERVLFVGLTRAERVCALAFPESALERMKSILTDATVDVEVCRI